MMTSHVRVGSTDAMLSCRRVGDGLDYFLHVVPRGGCPVSHQLNDAPADGGPKDEETARQEAVAILSRKYGIHQDLSGVGFEAC